MGSYKTLIFIVIFIIITTLLAYLYITEIIIFIDTENKLFFRNFSFTPETLGQLGDYFGGVLNPTLSFISIILLIKTIKRMDEGNSLLRKQTSRIILERNAANIIKEVSDLISKTKNQTLTISVNSFNNDVGTEELITNKDIILETNIASIFSYFQYELTSGIISDHSTNRYRHVGYCFADENKSIRNLIEDIKNENSIFAEIIQVFHNAARELARNSHLIDDEEIVYHFRELMAPLQFNRMNIGTVGERSFYISLLSTDHYIRDFFYKYRILAPIFKKKSDSSVYVIDGGVLNSNMLDYKIDCYVESSNRS